MYSSTIMRLKQYSILILLGDCLRVSLEILFVKLSFVVHFHRAAYMAWAHPYL